MTFAQRQEEAGKRFFARLRANLDKLEARLGPQPEITAIRESLPKLGRPKGTLRKATPEVQAIVKDWFENDRTLDYGQGRGRFPTTLTALAERCNVSTVTIYRVMDVLGLPYKAKR